MKLLLSVSVRYYLTILCHGGRPVLVVSPAAFNEATKLPVILPIPPAASSPAAWAYSFSMATAIFRKMA
ncbi:hypothetical protein [Pseudoduganella namucuonensis]|uniref:hypothetical protein n=1 Tax=Pseudoduganella namucuonensis TaxID=1035707 RepID=UPI0015A606FC|nr:hypothetical protein [Pseudoduganella namucuonensis]